ncbi:DUF7657 domain-containing protein [Larsenimonas rhizosphaerae]|uniref:Uncharacterized protein n=1 Tax=Larsenimonas rhizosphaerae TaxID=2944682 RepID=A0AA41ZHG1_9GAMM|nr:hypothetical protein [Larsenimonas rhizosphaerae]MCX2524832.1 hypothetical protein [Larsenimonas rhizosphaerae]
MAAFEDKSVIEESHDHYIALRVTLSALLIFLVLVVSGLTGSSFQNLMKSTAFVKQSGHEIFFKSQGVRSDEWLVSTPMAISQYNHVPERFPIVNDNYGLSGKNTLVVGMLGLPSSSFSTVGKPSTWGFFFLPIKNALSWYWWFPLFATFLALLWMLKYCFSVPATLASLASLFFVTSPYIWAWSFWPAYACFFPALSFCLMISLANKASNLPATLLKIFCLGLCFFGFFLVLYPPWQITLTFSFLAFGVPTLIGKIRHEGKSSAVFIGSILGSFLVAGLLFLMWWGEAGAAVNAISNTIYPGQRDSVVGGGVSASQLFFKGYAGPLSLSSNVPAGTNSSEASSFIFLFLPIFIAAFLGGRKRFSSKANFFAFWSAGLLACIYFVFCLFGLPEWLVKITLLGRVPTSRVDLSLGVVQTILLVLLFSRSDRLHFKAKASVAYFLMSITWALIAFLSVQEYLNKYDVSFSFYLIVPVVVLAFIGSFSIFLNRKFFFFTAIVLFNVYSVFKFNPVSVSPSEVVPSKAVEKILLKDKTYLVFGSQVNGMALASMGFKTLSGVFYYPDKKLWSFLDPEKKYSEIYNRYQHLFFILDEREKGTIHFETPRPDVVRVYIDSDSFDFSDFPVDYLIGYGDECSKLSGNLSVEIDEKVGSFCRYKIKSSD